MPERTDPAQSERKVVMLATLDNALELAIDAGATHEEIAEAVKHKTGTTDRPSSQRKPPLAVSGGKRLNFSRRDVWDDTITQTFTGFGKDESCVPSCSWEELCAMAKLIVDHPAFRLPELVSDIYPPEIEDEDV